MAVYAHMQIDLPFALFKPWFAFYTILLTFASVPKLWRRSRETKRVPPSITKPCHKWSKNFDAAYSFAHTESDPCGASCWAYQQAHFHCFLSRLPFLINLSRNLITCTQPITAKILSHNSFPRQVQLSPSFTPCLWNFNWTETRLSYRVYWAVFPFQQFNFYCSVVIHWNNSFPINFRNLQNIYGQ